MWSFVLISLTLFVKLSIALSPLVCFFACPGAGGNLAIAAATAALASRFASSRDLLVVCVGRGATDLVGAGACAWVDAEPLTTAFDLVWGLIMGTAGMMRPLFVPVCTCLAGAGASIATGGAGGAKASATFGLDSVGGGGPLWPTAGGAGVTDEMGSLTVAAGFSTGNSC